MCVFYHLVRFLIGSVLLYAALGKLRHPFEFLAVVLAYQMVPPLMGLLIAAILPWLELLVGLGLLIRFSSRGNWLLAAGLCGMFLIATSSALSRGLAISCGCLGGADDQISAATVLRSILLFGVTAVGLFLANRFEKSGDAKGRVRFKESVSSPVSDCEVETVGLQAEEDALIGPV